ncbi:uncharacterized protein CCR75_009361 [Bremia lactucae]|uniref:ATPase AAA-type core domain-containing protein n=1 Tax=Bremia lactucae TaxID=4779 RepID=A0A976FN59_BRELC|nr:hypothetical protein CCR75_009361 [Bremia lactucae]
MASPDLSSWLERSKSDLHAISDAQSSHNQGKSSSVISLSDFPLDICFQVRAKDTVTRISPEKCTIIKEVDSESDDADFDERAHWARRNTRKKSRAVRRSAGAEKSQPSIAYVFVNKEEFKAEAKDANEKVISSVSTLANLRSEEGKEKSGELNRTKDKMEKRSVEQDYEASIKKIDTSITILSSKRPKRQAVVRAEILRQQQMILDAVAAKNKAACFLTPPPSTKKSYIDGNAMSGGRKRKLEMSKKKMSSSSKNGSTTTSPGENKASPQSFFLSDHEKKQLKEIEAVSMLREQLRQTREKDLAYFAGKTANPFFQTRSGILPGGKAESATAVIERDEAGLCYEAKQRVEYAEIRWIKMLPLFPEVQHVVDLYPDVDAIVTNRKPFERSTPTINGKTRDETLYRGGKLPSGIMSQLKVAINGQVCTESSFCEQFWFRSYLDSSRHTCDEAIGDTTSQELCAGSAVAKLPKQETELIDELVETHGMGENLMRELLIGLEQARKKRLGRVQNLSLVDRYMPVSASGLIGNYEPLHTLSSWLSAWKIGGGERERLSCFASELFNFEDCDSNSEDESRDLCRLFILEGESGSGKSAAVYACAEELGYEIIEINAAQNRSGKNILELCGEATQSTRVLHVGGQGESKKLHKKKRRRQSESRKSLDKATAASLSLVLFEDVDLIFDEDKGFFNAICSIAKHSKCPIVVTCAQVPDGFPSKPGRLCRKISKPSMDEFATWMRLVAFVEGLQVAPSLVDALGKFFGRDVRRSLLFLEVNLPTLKVNTTTHWRWQHVSKDICEKNQALQINIPAWTVWALGPSTFDALTSNLLAELDVAADAEESALENKSIQEKQKDLDAMSELAEILDSSSIADTWMAPNAISCNEEVDKTVMLFERLRLAALELRRSSLYRLGTSTSSLNALYMRRQRTCASACIQRTLDSAFQATHRRSQQVALAQLKAKFELPLAYKGCGRSEPRFTLDYMPMVGRLLSSTGLQGGRRRTSRRNHYLSDVLRDMTLIDELPAFNAYLRLNEDDIIAATSTHC